MVVITRDVFICSFSYLFLDRGGKNADVDNGEFFRLKVSFLLFSNVGSVELEDDGRQPW